MRLVAAGLALALLGVPRPEMPNLTQTQISGLPGGGRYFCCPTANADALLWLDKNGYRGLAPDGPDDQSRGEALVKELARYFKSGDGFVNYWCNYFTGLPEFLRDHGYGRSRLTWFGDFDGEPVNYGSLQVPTLRGLREGNGPNAYVTLALGTFFEPDENGFCKRIGGQGYHWVTLIDTDPVQKTITFNDPLPGPENPKRALTLKAVEITRDRPLFFVDPDRGPARDNPRPGTGLYILEDYPHKANGQFTIIEGALFVRLFR